MWIRSDAICCVSATSPASSWDRLPKNGGILSPTPSGSNKSSMVNPLSAITSSPLCSKPRKPLRSTSCTSDIHPVYSEDTKIICPAGLIATSALNVLADLYELYVWDCRSSDDGMLTLISVASKIAYLI